MSQYIAHILNSNADSINVYEITNAKCSVFNISSFTELNILNETDSLIVLIPSSRVTSYEFEENKSLSKQINIYKVSLIYSVFIYIICLISTQATPIPTCDQKDVFPSLGYCLREVLYSKEADDIFLVLGYSS